MFHFHIKRTSQLLQGFLQLLYPVMYYDSENVSLMSLVCIISFMFWFENPSSRQCFWFYSTAIKQLLAVCSLCNLWTLKYQSPLIPTTIKMEKCLLFGAGLAWCSRLWWRGMSIHAWCLQCGVWFSNSNRGTGPFAEVLPYIQQDDIGRLMCSVFLCLWRASSSQHRPRSNHALHQSPCLHLLLPSDKSA